MWKEGTCALWLYLATTTQHDNKEIVILNRGFLPKFFIRFLLKFPSIRLSESVSVTFSSHIYAKEYDVCVVQQWFQIFAASLKERNCSFIVLLWHRIRRRDDKVNNCE